jgi:uncharacterized HAD superfamily protein
MNFRSVSDLFSTVRRQQHKLPRDIDLVVGVPRSGLLAANVVSLLLHRPLTDLSSFLDGRVYGGFSRRFAHASQNAGDFKSVLIVDDSIGTGSTMRKIRSQIQELNFKHKFKYVSVYGKHQNYTEVDIVLESVPGPIMFEWNVMDHLALNTVCVDLEGVLCCDPTEAQDDDGENYLEFLTTAVALKVPRYKINSIVTARLERYRPQTESWLQRNGVQYDELCMLDLPSAVERRKMRGIDAEFKSEVYAKKKDCLLFIERSIGRARIIRERTGKSVLAYEDMIFFPEGSLRKLARTANQQGIRGILGPRLPHWSKTFIKSMVRLR